MKDCNRFKENFRPHQPALTEDAARQRSTWNICSKRNENIKDKTGSTVYQKNKQPQTEFYFSFLFWKKKVIE